MTMPKDEWSLPDDVESWIKKADTTEEHTEEQPKNRYVPMDCDRTITCPCYLCRISRVLLATGLPAYVVESQVQLLHINISTMSNISMNSYHWGLEVGKQMNGDSTP